MKNEFVPYEPALELKALGFNEPCFGYYGDNLELIWKSVYAPWINSERNLIDNNFCTAPTFSQAFRWFRDKKYQAEILWRGDFGDFCWKIGRFKYGYHYYSCCSCSNRNNGFNSYEEAELACLKKLIELIK